jgi:hypothetical protein
MSKNEDNNKKGIGSDDYNNNSNEFSTAGTSLQKKLRKDAKGNLILKKKFPIKKTKHHAYLIDTINPNKQLVDIIDIESYKKYNLEVDDEVEEENEKENNEEKLEESKVVVSQGCCNIF